MTLHDVQYRQSHDARGLFLMPETYYLFRTLPIPLLDAARCWRLLAYSRRRRFCWLNRFAFPVLKVLFYRFYDEKPLLFPGGSAITLCIFAVTH